MLDKIKEISDKIEEKKVEDKKTKFEKKIEEVKEKWIEEIINEKNISFSEKVNSWFTKIEFLELKQEEKAEVAVKVKKDASPDKLYWMEIFLSGVIASLGLLQNSVAVIIGAMLIAPFLRPINGIAFWIARWEKKFFFNSMKVLLISSLVAIITGFIVMNITGLYKETPEILSRTSPNIIDLFIAIFSAMVALLSLRYKRLWESVAWVAMAAALMPPLWVIWMELALWNYVLAWWASMLFITNIVAIILVWILAFWLYGFTPNDWWKQKKAFLRIFTIILLISIISIPLVRNLIFLQDRWYVEKKVNENLYLILDKKIDDFTVSNISIKELTKNKLNLKAEVKILEWVKFYDYYTDFINRDLTVAIWRDTEVEIELIRVANIVSKDEEEKENIENIKKQEEQNLEKTKQQEEYTKKIREELEKELNEKLKNELEERMKKEFNFILEKKILEIQKLDNLNSAKDEVLVWSWEIKK